MSQQSNNPNQVSLILRLLCGGYLVYTAWGLRDAFQESPLFIVAAVVFAVVGLVLGVVSLRQLIKSGYFSMGRSSAPAETAEESDEGEETYDE